MPRLNPSLTSCVFFLYGKNAKTGNTEGPLGTGVFIGVARRDQDSQLPALRHAYAVTCNHVAPRGASIIRLNTREGKSRYIELEPHEWEFIENDDDIAAVDITDRISAADEVLCVPQNLFATREFMRYVEFGVGEDGFMLGLFTGQPGKERNLIAGRFGNVSMLAHDDAPLKQPHGIKRPSHLFDTRSRSGFSGSPVFVYRTPSGDLRDLANPKIKIRASGVMGTGIGGGPLTSMGEDWGNYWDARNNTFLKLFGIHAGQYPEKVTARQVRKVESESDDIIRDGDALSLPSGMTIVVPAWEITRLLNLPLFMNQRRDRELTDQQTTDITPEPESAESENLDIAKVRDETLRTMLSTPPQSRKKPARKRVKRK